VFSLGHSFSLAALSRMCTPMWFGCMKKPALTSRRYENAITFRDVPVQRHDVSHNGWCESIRSTHDGLRLIWTLVPPI
jgi:hypothetical protein